MSEHAAEVARGERFEFGRNWARFLAHLDDARVAEAERSLRAMLGAETLAGRTFLDVGSGSGLFSLAARRLGATVRSFDYDPQSVACTRELRRRYFPGDAAWAVEEGSVLDRGYLAALGQYDVVYSWGVLHHTGAMWQALANVAPLVRPGGNLFIAIYNRQPILTPFWSVVKRAYVRGNGAVKRVMEWGFFALFAGAAFLADALRGRNPADRHRGRNHRGMNLYRDVVDWIGGWPFEVASTDEITAFYEARGFVPRTVVSCGGKHGCNEFVLARATD